MVGRDVELAVLVAASVRAAAGGPVGVLVEGEAGIGKSRLVQEFTHRLDRPDAHVLAGACTPAGGRERPFFPWVAVLEALPPLTGDGAERPERHPVGAAPSSESGQMTHGQMLASLSRTLLEAAGARPTVVVLEDLHWADESSLVLLDYLLRVGRDDRLLVVGTVRTHDPAYEVVRARHRELLRLPNVVGLPLDRLGREDVARLLAGLADGDVSERAVDEAFSRSGGVPFLVEQLSAAGVATGSVDASFAADLLGHRVSMLSDDAHRLVELCAVAGESVDLSHLVEASGLDDDAFDAAIAEMQAHGLVTLDVVRGTCAFRHALLREAALLQTPPRRSARWHRRLAEAIEAHHPWPPGTAATLARHWQLAGDRERTLASAVMAAREADLISAMAEKLRLLRVAVDSWGDVPDGSRPQGTDLVSLLLEAAEAANNLGDLDGAKDLIERGRSLLPREEDRPRRACFDLLECNQRWSSSDVVERQEVERIVADMAGLPPSRLHVRALGILSYTVEQDGDLRTARTLATEALEMAETLGDATSRCDCLCRLGLVEAVYGDRPGALGHLWGAHDLADRLGDLSLRAQALTGLCVGLWELGDTQEAFETSLAAQEVLGGDRPGPLPVAWCNSVVNSVEGLLDRGRWEEARTRLTALDEHGSVPRIQLWVVECERLLAAWTGTLEPDDDPPAIREEWVRGGQLYDVMFTLTRLCDELAHLGRLEEARTMAALLVFQSRVEKAPPVFVWELLHVLARMEAEYGDDVAPEAAFVGRLEELGSLTPAANSRTRVLAASVRADLAAVRGDPSLELCREAVAGFGRLDMPYHQAFAYHRLGIVAAQLAEHTLARDAFGQSLAITWRLGAAPLHRRTREAARSLGVRLTAHPVGRRGDSGLTARELEVLVLLAEGASNREVARRLVMSEKTASVHVSHVLAKLQASSRGEAVAIARRSGVITDEMTAPTA